MFKDRNTLLVALLQVGVIIAGTLGAGVSRRLLAALGVSILPLSNTLLMNYGLAALGIPLVWGILALALRQRPHISENLKALVLFSGILILLLLVAMIAQVILAPWIHSWGTIQRQEPAGLDS